ncbi:MAG: TenA family protein [Calditrichia bacterium]
MARFHQKLLKNSHPLWKKLLEHPFLKMTASGEIPEQTFKTWMQQDYVFVREAIPFVAILLAKAPLNLRTNFVQILNALDRELELFRQNAEKHGVDLSRVTAAPTCHAYLQFLMNTAYNGSFPEGFTVLYAAEKAYLDSWTAVKTGLKQTSPWQEFIDNWTSKEFQQYVTWLENTLDELVAGEPKSTLLRLEELFKTTTRYEYLFWDMAANEESWPI